MKIRHILVMAIAASFFGCTSSKEMPSTLKQTEAAQDEIVTSSGVLYTDSSLFDKQLSKALEETNGEVVTKLPEISKVSNLPPRLDIWLSYIHDNDGDVEMVAEGGALKSLFTDALNYGYKAYRYTQSKMIFTPAKNYNAKVYYNPDTAVMQRVVFVPRE